VKALEKGETADKVVEGLARAITNKLIHSPSVQMKKASSQGRDELLQLIQELYELSDQDKD
jgi:glutamyl-tRNA reductase